MSVRFTESDVEQAALAWLEAAGWQVTHGPESARHMPTTGWRLAEVEEAVRRPPRTPLNLDEVAR